MVPQTCGLLSPKLKHHHVFKRTILVNAFGHDEIRRTTFTFSPQTEIAKYANNISKAFLWNNKRKYDLWRSFDSPNLLPWEIPGHGMSVRTDRPARLLDGSNKANSPDWMPSLWHVIQGDQLKHLVTTWLHWALSSYKVEWFIFTKKAHFMMDLS